MTAPPPTPPMSRRRDFSRPITLVELPDVIGPDGAVDEQALAQLESSAAGGEAPAPPTPAAKPLAERPVVSGLAFGGLAAAAAAVDRVLGEHGETLRTLAAGPISGALLQNWWAILLAYLLARKANAWWHEWNARSKARDAQAAAQARAQLRALRLVVRESERVAEQVEALRGEVAGVRAIAQLTDERQRRESEDLRRHVDNVAGDLDRRLRRIEPAP